MPGLERAARAGRIEAAFLQPQARRHRAALRLRGASRRADGAGAALARAAPGRCRNCACRCGCGQRGCLRGFRGPRTVHLDIVDYPGEWLLDLALLDQDFGQWSRQALARGRHAPRSGGRSATVWPGPTRPRNWTSRPPPPLAPPRDWTGLSCRPRATPAIPTARPGRFLLPGDLEGSPALTFAPLPPSASPARVAGPRIRPPVRGLQVAGGQTLLPRPFRPHRPAGGAASTRLVRSHAGPRALEDLRQALSGILWRPSGRGATPSCRR